VQIPGVSIITCGANLQLQQPWEPRDRQLAIMLLKRGGGQRYNCSPAHLTCCSPIFVAVQDKQDNITVPACQEEVFYFELMEVKDFR